MKKIINIIFPENKDKDTMDTDVDDNDTFVESNLQTVWVSGRLGSHTFFWWGVILMYLDTLNTKITTTELCKIGNNWFRAPKVENVQKYLKILFFLYLFSNFEI